MSVWQDGLRGGRGQAGYKAGCKVEYKAGYKRGAQMILPQPVKRPATPYLLYYS